MTISANRVVAYIDGFNLYYGMRSRGWRRYYWLDLNQLAERLLRSGQMLESVKYFTARVIPDVGSEDKARRQNTYLEALGTLPDLAIQYGYYLPKTQQCSACGATWRTYEEKMTDVNIAVEMLSDAYENRFDTAIVVSADSDLARPITAIRERFPGKRVVVAFPPNRFSFHLRNIATCWHDLADGISGKRIASKRETPPKGPLWETSAQQNYPLGGYVNDRISRSCCQGRGKIINLAGEMKNGGRVNESRPHPSPPP